MAIDRHVKRGIIDPSRSNYVIVFLIGTIVGGIAFGVGFSLGQRLIDNLSNRMQQPPPPQQQQQQQPAQAQQATPTTAFLGQSPKFPYRSKWNQPFWN